jgi:hypothetical protein
MALRPSIRVRTRIVYVFIVSPEEILHYCVHSSVPFGVAGRLTARIIAYFVRRRKWENGEMRVASTCAKALLGRVLCRRLDDGTVLRARIVEHG